VGTVLLLRCEPALGDGGCKGEWCRVLECMGLLECDRIRRQMGMRHFFEGVRKRGFILVRSAVCGGHGECGGMIGRERGSGGVG
jgi:hypothetical protein